VPRRSGRKRGIFSCGGQRLARAHGISHGVHSICPREAQTARVSPRDRLGSIQLPTGVMISMRCISRISNANMVIISSNSPVHVWSNICAAMTASSNQSLLFIFLMDAILNGIVHGLD